jgi:hypothetical protein
MIEKICLEEIKKDYLFDDHLLRDDLLLAKTRFSR